MKKHARTSGLKRCPNCRRDLDTVNVYSTCKQVATVNEKGVVLDWGDPVIQGTVKIECPECRFRLEKIIKEE